MKRVRPRDEGAQRLGGQVMGVANKMFGHIGLDINFVRGLDTYECRVEILDNYGTILYTWTFYVPAHAVLTDEEIRVMLERDYLRSMDGQ